MTPAQEQYRTLDETRRFSEAIGVLSRTTGSQADEIAATINRAQNLVYRDKDPELTAEEQHEAIATAVQISKNGATISAEGAQLAVKLGLPKLLALPRVDVPADMWEDVSDDQDRSRLAAEILFCGVPMHVEALESSYDEDSFTQEFTGSQGEIADDVYAAVAADGTWRTATIDGREYAIIITPFCN